MAKSSVKRFVVAAALVALIGAGVEVAVYDTLFDHTKSACLLSKIPYVGIHHQERAMVRDVKKQGWNIVTGALECSKDSSDIDTVSAYYNYKPLAGMEDQVNYLNNYQNHISVNIK
ncbi:MAG: hypothetical protein J6X02_04885 [Bacilli bacterium]|nr:hypothetical protein [Bacilli bacterium]